MVLQIITGVIAGAIVASGEYANVEPPRSAEIETAVFTREEQGEPENAQETPYIAGIWERDEELELRYFAVPLSYDLQRHIWNTAIQFGIDPLLVYAIIEEESLFRANAVSKTNDYGLMQINAINSDWLLSHYGITDLLSPYQNVIAGCAILKWTKQFTDGSLDMLLLYYGCGVGRGRELWAQGVKRLTFGDRMIEILEKYRNGERDER